MECVVLCAGYATRLGPLTERRPKHLLPVGGRPMIEWLLDRLAEASFDAANLVVNDTFAGQFEAWRDAAQRGEPRLPLAVRLLNDGTRSPSDRLGSVGDLALALDELAPANGFFVANGDNVFTFSLRPMLAAYRQRGSTIALYDVKDADLVAKAGEARLGADDRVTDFIEKPATPAGTWASIGLYAFEGRVQKLIRRYLAEGGSPDRTGDLIAWLHAVEPLHGWRAPSDALWFDIGTPDQYRAADAALSRGEVTQGDASQ